MTLHKANSLLIAIGLITLLIILSVSVSSFIIQSSVNIRSLDFAHKAFYGAESGVELSLLALKKHLPGFTQPETSIVSETLTFQYSIAAQTSRIPKTEETKNFLLPNDTAVLALFKDTAQRTEDPPAVDDLEDSEKFSLSFELPLSDLGTTYLSWTIFGFIDRGDGKITESMNGIACTVISEDCRMPVIGTGVLDMNSHGSFKNSLGEYEGNYAVKEFLNNHTQNYLSLTYLSAGYDPLTSPERDRMQYHVEFEPAMADENFLITSTGTMKNYTQTEQIVVPQGDLSPAFFFGVISPDGR